MLKGPMSQKNRIKIRKCWPRAVILKIWSRNSSVSTTCKLIRNAYSWAQPQNFLIKFWKWGPTTDKPSRWFWCRLKFENHWTRGPTAGSMGKLQESGGHYCWSPFPPHWSSKVEPHGWLRNHLAKQEVEEKAFAKQDSEQLERKIFATRDLIYYWRQPC